MKNVAIAVFVALAMVAFMVEPGQAIPCPQVESYLSPCVPYLTNGGTPTQACCTGVSNIQKNTPTVADRQGACQCIKDAASRLPKIDEAAATNLPTACNVKIGVPISKSINCKE
ncbi:hypothetical protein FEM48_Zijuj04G0154100 [Ziziphus jujuba var. spinosa]|uniref:Non-specific lipid-transfer protein n=1 Tax=Ziziphus jujuba var. spinosa TaxID=714518 RepID=A0A978VKN0_ZIZJJ|nr:hypothetical protein FEM48_Zijuj04G0154100 [Ziziphus jujuba var. spinosa]